jgi:glycerol uptake facilitator protein
MTEMRKLVAEIIGTFILVFFGTVSVVVTLLLSTGASAPMGGFNIGLGALGGLGDWLAIGLSFGIALTVAIYAFGRVSGAHFNPAVTIALWSIKKFPAKDVIPYIIAQIIGALIGTFAIVAILGPVSSTVGVLGSVGAFGTVGPVGVFLAEFIGTMLLMLAVMAVAVDENAVPGFGALTIGLAVAGIVIAIGNISGSGINPARSLSPMIGNLVVAGSAGAAGGLLWIYIVAPILGAILGAYIYEYLYKDLGY